MAVAFAVLRGGDGAWRGTAARTRGAEEKKSPLRSRPLTAKKRPRRGKKTAGAPEPHDDPPGSFALSLLHGSVAFGAWLISARG